MLSALTKKETIVISLLVVSITTLVGYGMLWISKYDSTRPFAFDYDAYVDIDLSDTKQLPVTSQDKAQVIQFWDPHCPCSDLAKEHLIEIQQHYAAQGVAFTLITPQSNDRYTDTFLDRFQLPNEPLRKQLAALPYVQTSPAALVLKPDNTLAYLGPYSTGAGCFTGEGRFVEQTLDKILSGNSREQINMLAVGCYCRWQNQ